MGESDRAVVRTYVPEYQKRQWREHADDLEMSQSEFVRTMVQAGRRGFGAGDEDESADDGSGNSPSNPPSEEPDPPGADPGGRAFETVVLDALQSDHHSFEELLDIVTDDAETRLDETLQQLQSENRVAYSGRHGGYALIDDE